MLSSADRFEIYELVQLYGHLLDERQLSRLGEVVTSDVVLDSKVRAGGMFRGLEQMRAGLEEWAGREDSSLMSLAHHATNVMVEAVDADSAKVVHKGIIVHADGTVHSNVYRLSAVRTDQGWRISHITNSMITRENIPEIS